MDAKAINKFPIREYLAARGIRPVKDRGYYGLYHSPLREDRTPSMKVDYDKNLWIDYGAGEGGTLIDLMMRMERCDAGEAMRRLGQKISGTPAFSFHGNHNPVPPHRESAITIEQVRPLENPALLAYIKERGINLNTAREHCSEVHYRVADKFYFAVGFRNDAGGWELRNPLFKGSSTPKNITTLDNSSDTAMVFEGFIDFLSYLSLKGNLSPSIDTAVLNSVTNLQKAVPFLARHSVIHAFLDNDDAGRKALARLEESVPSSEVIDQSVFYRDYKDLNDYWQEKRRLASEEKNSLAIPQVPPHERQQQEAEWQCAMSPVKKRGPGHKF